MTVVKTALGEASALALDAADPPWRGGASGSSCRRAAAAGRRRTSPGCRSVPSRSVRREAVERELDRWGDLGVEGWFDGDDGWLEADGRVAEMTAGIVGARPDEVATLNTLTVNLHLLLAAFYRPAGRRTAILIDAPTFPSDRYAVDVAAAPPRPGSRAATSSSSGRATARRRSAPRTSRRAIHEHRDRLAHRRSWPASTTRPGSCSTSRG